MLMGAATLIAGAGAGAVRAAGRGPAIHVLKDPGCGCCTAWIEVLEAAGFAVTAEHAGGDRLMSYKASHGIPREMTSCHTARVEGYMIEGHVPVADIRRLLAERPAAIGLAVPDMPYGSPGIGPETEREAYDVFLIRRDGGSEVFASYPAA
jgi:hypothetical protein